jgi:hypothetical protein
MFKSFFDKLLYVYIMFKKYQEREIISIRDKKTKQKIWETKTFYFYLYELKSKFSIILKTKHLFNGKMSRIWLQDK